MGITTSKSAEMPLVHAGLALGLVVVGLFGGTYVLPSLGQWPYYLLAPLTLYVIIVLAVGPLRRSLNWVRVGRLDRPAWVACGAVVVVSCAALVIWHALAQPDLTVILSQIPQGPLPLLMLAGVGFAAVNALLEEVLFRGLLYDALRVSYGVVGALVIQAVTFGAFHYHGFPSGAIGVALATVYGLMQGGLRVFAGGLGVCWAGHVLADATIFALLLGER